MSSSPPPPYPGSEDNKGNGAPYPPQEDYKMSSNQPPNYAGPQGGYPSAPTYSQSQQDGYPPPQAGYPPPQAGYPPPHAGYPPSYAGYPPPHAGYPPSYAGYPPPHVGYPPSHARYPQSNTGQQNTTVVVAQPPITLVQTYGSVPVRTACPHCRADIITATHFENGTFSWAICMVLCVLGCDLGCCLIPFCVEGCQDVIHTCPNCHQHIARWNRM